MGTWKKRRGKMKRAGKNVMQQATYKRKRVFCYSIKEAK